MSKNSVRARLGLANCHLPTANCWVYIIESHPFAKTKSAKDSLFAVKLYFLSGEVQENLSLLGCWSQFKLGEQAGAVIVGAPAEHAEDGVQHLAGDGDEGLHFGFVACE